VSPLPPGEVVRTPEGIELHFRSATASERLLAFAADALVVALVMAGVGFALLYTVGIGGALIWFFLIRHGYFVWSEIRGNGTTLGKRQQHLRVVRADGGPLTAEVLLARNLTREVELFLPLQLVAAPEVLAGDHGAAVRIVAFVWVLGLMFFPLANRRRLRIGDLLAGTRVVYAPPAKLATDLAAGSARATPAARAAAPTATTTDDPAAAEFVFAAAQLQIYGEKELTVLEDVLRKARLPGGAETINAVAQSIRKRIGWTAPVPASAAKHFLRAFYAAQRRQLEQQLLLGRRKERKSAAGRRDRTEPSDGDARPGGW
jgi:uncharacterized RDD family membrane protein YckC